MKSLIKKRREQKAICPKCKSPDYKIEDNEYKWMKKNIFCNSCGNSWQYGYDGGIYMELDNKN